jgi:photosystem II stability/assembly factor-like uncharacterized protein
MEACLAPNGPTIYQADGPCTRLHVGTAEGVVTLEREAPGAAWRAARHSLAGKHISSLLLEPKRGGLFAGVHDGGLYASSDGGQTWQELSDYSRPEDPVYRDIHRLVQRPSNPDEMYFTGGAGLYFSADGGETWEHLSTHRARIGYPDALMFSPDESMMFMAGAACSPGDWRRTNDADAAVGRSRDAGRTWEILSRGLPAHIVGNFEAMTMAAWPGGFTLFAATTDCEVFASEDEGATWATIASGLAPISKGAHYVPLRRPAVGAVGVS